MHPCVTPSAAAALPADLTFTTAQQQAILDALNAGLPVGELNRGLQAAHIGNFPHAAVGVDLNGDHAEDIVVSLFDPNSQTKPPQGVLLAFVCQGSSFGAPIVFVEPATGMAWGAPLLQFAQDLNADGKDELVISAAHCSQDGQVCRERYAILAWQNGGLVDLLQDADPQGYPSAVPYVEDPDGDGIYDFIVSTGSGKRLVWHYTKGVWTPAH